MHKNPLTANRLLDRISEARSKAMHLTNIKRVKPRVNTKSPKRYTHYSFNPKGDRLREERCTEIERENRILLEKMSVIASSTRRSKSVTNIRYKKSLNDGQRKKKLVQITIENYALLKRMQEQQPTYSTLKWSQERKETEKHLSRLSENSINFRRTNSRRRLASSSSQRSNLSMNLGDIFKRNDSPKAFTVCKKLLHINDRYYIGEVSANSKYVFISLFDKENPEKYSLKLHTSEAASIMENTEDYSLLLSKLSFDGTDLILRENPKEPAFIQ
ncbi:unnamed protein product [Blepharisma stoltei]|uniref:Uncharacterized protein n=1 Tax=Blepharisma stoltei TaxID=1481888 RepID=A0AAU9ILW7_9CILI|nr:unnamed protein product [Blepharisma stoltei]